jgi:hypothetical protein
LHWRAEARICATCRVGSIHVRAELLLDLARRTPSACASACLRRGLLAARGLALPDELGEVGFRPARGRSACRRPISRARGSARRACARARASRRPRRSSRLPARSRRALHHLRVGPGQRTPRSHAVRPCASASCASRLATSSW